MSFGPPSVMGMGGSPFLPGQPSSGVGNEGGGKKNMPPPQDFMAANAAQTKANRPDQTNAFGTTSAWTQNPDGTWTQTSNFSGGLGEANQNLQGQLAQATATPFDPSQAPALQYGEDARKAATDASYNQLTSRLDPMWNQRQEAERARLTAQGLDPGSEAYTRAMDDFSRGRNDAYQGAMNSSIGLGLNAADQMFNQSLGAHNTSIADMVRGRTLPLQQLQGLGQLTGQSGFNSDQGLSAAGMQGAQDWQRYLESLSQQSDIGGGIGQLLGAAGSILPLLLSDERAKMKIRRLPQEAAPGVPWAYYEYRDHPGVEQFGVIAQDVEKKYPDYVRTREDGMKVVDYRFMEAPRG